MAETTKPQPDPIFHPMSGPLTGGDLAGDRFCPGVEKIGCGYDVINGSLADPEAVKKRLFDRGEELAPGSGDYSLLREHLGDVAGFSAIQPITVDSGETLAETGSSLSEVGEKLAGKMDISGKYGKFEGELEAAAQQTESSLSTNAISKHVGRYALYRLQMKTAANPRDLLLPQVRDMIDGTADFDPDQFFDDYGGYYIDGATFGGAIDFTAITNTLEFKSKISVSAALMASYDGALFGGDAKIEAETETAARLLQSSSKMMLRYAGGKPISALGSQAAFDDWLQSISRYVALIGFRPTDLRPVWSLAATPARAKELEQLFAEWAAGQGKGVPDTALIPLLAYKSLKPASSPRWYFKTNAGSGTHQNWSYRGNLNGVFVYPPNHPAQGMITLHRWHQPKVDGRFNGFYVAPAGKPRKSGDVDRGAIARVPSDNSGDYSAFEKVFSYKSPKNTVLCGRFYAAEGAVLSEIDGDLAGWVTESAAFNGFRPQAGFV